MSAERVTRVPDAPPFNARAYSDRLQETRQAEGALPAVPVFDKTKPDSIVQWSEWSRGPVKDRVNALCDFSGDIKDDLDAHKAADQSRHQTINSRLAALEAAVQAPPFPG